MDALALLCTLHADGPATLKRLRQAGCSSLESIESLELPLLAELLGTPTSAARRFSKEAKSLRERVGAGWLEREDATPARIASHGSFGAGRAAGSRDDTAHVAAPRHDAQPPSLPPSLPLGEQELVERVLKVWRERDRDETSSSVSSPSPHHESDLGRGLTRAGDVPLAHAVFTTAPHACASSDGAPPETAAVASSVPTLTLTPERLDGLDAATCERLAAFGVTTIDALAHVDSLALARTIDIGYTRLARLQFLAARANGSTARASDATENAAPTASAPSPRKVSLRETPASADVASNEIDLERAVAAPSPSHARAAAAQLQRADAESSGGPFV